MSDPDGPWHTVQEQCNYCAYRWIEVMPEKLMNEVRRTGPLCPQCGIRNEPRTYLETDMRKPPARSA